MSGHSKWSSIKHQKGEADAKRGKIFTKMAKEISLSARDGKDPAANFRLRIAIEKARSLNVPKDNIERAILRGSGELKGQKQLEEITYEGYGPEGIALIIETVTDNKNRTTANIKHILNKHNGSLAETNAVMWNFKRKGAIRISKEQINKADLNTDGIELIAIDAGAEDIQTEDEGITIYIDPSDLITVKKILTQNNIPIDTAETELVPENAITLDENKSARVQTLIEALEEDDDVTNVFTNLG